MLETIRSLKNKALEVAARRYLNGLAPDIGQVEGLDLDTGRKTVKATVRLRGSEWPVEVLGRYELTQQGDRLTLRVLDVGASAPWLHAAADRWLAGRDFEVPEDYRTLVAAVL